MITPYLFEDDEPAPSDPNLSFQRYAHDKLLGGTPPAIDDQPRKQNKIALAPRTFHEATSNKTIEWLVEEALRGLVKEIL
jgi:hypothetical protein